eukprot:g655.t1
MAFLRYSSSRLRRKGVIHAFYAQSFSPFSTENENGAGRGRGGQTLQSMETPTAPGAGVVSTKVPVQGRGRKSRFAEELGLKLDPVKEAEKLREYIPEENIHRSRYEDVEISPKRESKIRVVNNTQNQTNELDLQKLDQRVKKLPFKKVITKLGKQQEGVVPEEKEKKNSEVIKEQKETLQIKSATATLVDEMKVEGVPEKAEKVIVKTKAPIPHKPVTTKSQESTKKSLQNKQKILRRKKETDWLSELSPKPQENPKPNWLNELEPGMKLNRTQESPESNWLDELGPGVKLHRPQTALDSAKDSTEPKSEAPSSSAPIQVRSSSFNTEIETTILKLLEEEAHYPPVHKAYQEEDEVMIDSDQKVHEFVEEFIVEDKHSASGKILVQFENEDSAESVISSDASDDDIGDDGGGQGIQSTEAAASTAIVEEEEEEKSSMEDFNQLKEEEQSSVQEVEDSIKEEIINEGQWAVFDKLKENTETKQVHSEEETGGLASLLQGLMKKDRKQTDSLSPSSGSMMESLGWGKEQTDVSPLDFKVTQMQMEYDFRERFRPQRSTRTRMTDAYGRMKARTPEERRQRAMRSGKAMEMALEGKLDEFDPDDFEEIELPEIPQMSRGRGRVRGGFRGRGRGRRGGFARNVPNLFKQQPIAKTPLMEVAPHLEEEYYHEDVMSKLGIRFSQHELMNMERYIQSLVSPCFNFNTEQPIPWNDLKRSSADKYLENHKGKVKAVMSACGFAFSDERWNQLKRNAIRDLSDYKQQESNKALAFGQSSFKSVKVRTTQESMSDPCVSGRRGEFEQIIKFLFIT